MLLTEDTLEILRKDVVDSVLSELEKMKIVQSPRVFNYELYMSNKNNYLTFWGNSPWDCLKYEFGFHGFCHICGFVPE